MLARLILLALGLLAQVLGLPADQSDPTQWGELGIATLVVWGSVELLRKSILSAVDGIYVHVLAAGVGMLFGVLLGAANVITGGLFEWIVFGLQATFFATIADLGLKKASGKPVAAHPEP